MWSGNNVLFNLKSFSKTLNGNIFEIARWGYIKCTIYNELRYYILYNLGESICVH